MSEFLGEIVLTRSSQTVTSTGRYSKRSFFFSSRRRHTRFDCDWSSDVCSSDLGTSTPVADCSHRWESRENPEAPGRIVRSEEHTSELQSQSNLVCRLLLEKKNKFDFRFVHHDPSDVLCKLLDANITHLFDVDRL